MSTRNGAQALILHRLNLLDISRLKVRGIQRRCVVDGGDAEGFVGKKKVLLAVAPIRPAKCLKDIQPSLKFGDDRPGVRSKRERRVQRQAKDRRLLDELK